MNKIEVNGVEYGELDVLIMQAMLREHEGQRLQNVSDFVKTFNTSGQFKIILDEALRYRLSRLAGTTLLEASIYTSLH